MDTNLVSAIAEAMRQIPAAETGMSDATWQMVLQVVMAIVVAYTAWRTHAASKVTDRIEKDVNSTALALAEEKKKDRETILLLAQQKSTQDERVRGMENVKAASHPKASSSFSDEQIAQIVKALKG